MKYMVMECHLSYAVVLDEQGKFLKVANLHYEVGQTVTDIIQMRQPEQQKTAKRYHQWIYSLAAMAACLLLAITSVFQMGQTVCGSVYLTINPAVRIDVNQKDVVIGLEGNNEDGNMLIADYSYKRKNLNLVMDELVQRAINMGYLHKGGQITLALDAYDDQWVVRHSDTLTTHLSNSLNEGLNVTITVTDRNSQSHEATTPEAPSESASSNSGFSVPCQPDDIDHEGSFAPEASLVSPASQTPAYGESDYGDPENSDPDDDNMEDDDPDDDKPGYDDLDHDETEDSEQEDDDEPDLDETEDGEQEDDDRPDHDEPSDDDPIGVEPKDNDSEDEDSEPDDLEPDDPEPDDSEPDDSDDNDSDNNGSDDDESSDEDSLSDEKEDGEENDDS